MTKRLATAAVVPGIGRLQIALVTISYVIGSSGISGCCGIGNSFTQVSFQSGGAGRCHRAVQ
eukprot:40178-Amphidinium_carterae.1